MQNRKWVEWIWEKCLPVIKFEHLFFPEGVDANTNFFPRTKHCIFFLGIPIQFSRPFLLGTLPHSAANQSSPQFGWFIWFAGAATRLAKRNVANQPCAVPAHHSPTWEWPPYLCLSGVAWRSALPDTTRNLTPRAPGWPVNCPIVCGQSSPTTKL